MEPWQILILVIIGVFVFIYSKYWWDLKQSEVSFKEFQERLNEYIDELIEKKYRSKCGPSFDYWDRSISSGYGIEDFLPEFRKREDKEYILSKSFYVTNHQFIVVAEVNRWDEWENHDRTRSITFKMDIK